MKQYHVSNHAIDRAVERLGYPREHAKGNLLSIIQSAYYVGDTSTEAGKIGKIFDHVKRRIRLVVGDNNVIVTVYPFPEDVGVLVPSLPEAFADDIRQLVQRKLNAKRREFQRKQRTLEIELAEVGLEIAQLKLNQAKAKSPKTRASLAEKISEFMARYERIQFEIDQGVKSFAEVAKGTEAFV